MIVSATAAVKLMLSRYSFATAGAALHSGQDGTQLVTVTDNALPV